MKRAMIGHRGELSFKAIEIATEAYFDLIRKLKG